MLRHPASYRDPSGFIYQDNGEYFRQINPSYFKEYHAIKNSNVYNQLWKKNWLIYHEEISVTSDKITLKPTQLNFLTYPYEWSFTAYKHAAQLTLRMQMFLLEKGFSLKDASAFNITFNNGKAVFIDTLSIEKYRDKEPWKGLKQFNEHFFAPLLLAQQHGSYYLKTLQHRINGFPLDEAAKLLSWKTKLSPTIYSHIYYLGKQKNDSIGEISTSIPSKGLDKVSQIKMLKALEMYISKMSLKENTEWSAYYKQTNYIDQAFTYKKDLIKNWNSTLNTEKIIDLGGNNGTFSKIVLPDANQVIVSDIDQSAIDDCYISNIKNKETQIIPMVTDLMQPAASIGFNNEERDSFVSRVQSFSPDLSMALALIHHLTLSGNVPFEMSASFFKSLSTYLIIEFPDRQDSWVQFILKSKRDAIELFNDYNLTNFENSYKKHYSIIKKEAIKGSHRTLYLMKRNER
ncbi:class I SAM-dependent methyltransferase [Nonlabens mediterrranea]|uniref:Class I SAM-dependent methyltransferase n=1 Tax=Nonlabens mediterrranea TaxID=1419947 RepID=A0ABS0AAK6_9FLAO|nr:class I SAM-dependent methyltransferase [Nonlabens mediterrranea]